MLATWLALALGDAAAAQGPSIDIGEPPGVSKGRGKLGPPLGEAETPELDSAPGTQDNRPVAGRLGPSVSRAPIGGLNPPTQPTPEEPSRFRPKVLEPASVPEATR